ncbi:MAG TPA: hypothetical protein DEB06_02410 [Phycisphaerales bacterium]|nr:hypothetical protein [Phycisphaerales bacterium]
MSEASSEISHPLNLVPSARVDHTSTRSGSSGASAPSGIGPTSRVTTVIVPSAATSTRSGIRA